MNFKSYYLFLRQDEIDIVDSLLEKFEKNQDEIIECLLEYSKTRDQDIFENIKENIMEEQYGHLKSIMVFMKKSFDRFCQLDGEILKIESRIYTERKKERRTERGKKQMEDSIRQMEDQILDLKMKKQVNLSYPVMNYTFPSVPVAIEPFDRIKQLEEENSKLRQGIVENNSIDKVVSRINNLSKKYKVREKS